MGGAPKERRRRRAGKRLSKRVFLESAFLLCSLKVFRCFKSNLLGVERRNGLSKNTLLDNRFPARRLLRSFGALWKRTKNFGNREWGGFQEGGFQIVERAAFSSR